MFTKRHSVILVTSVNIVSTFSFVSIVSIVNNVDIVIVVSTLCIVSNVNSAQYCKSHVMYDSQSHCFELRSNVIIADC